MTKMTEQALKREEIEMLLPWHAAGTLSRRDAQRVEAAMAEDAELARQFELVREEFGETIHLNETLGAPSHRAMDRLFADIEKEGSAERRQRFSFNIGAWIAEQFSQLAPRTLAYSATAAALVIALQAGVLGGLYLNQHGGQSGPQLASYETAGNYAMIRFAPEATIADMTKVLADRNLIVVEGPKAPPFAGMFKVRGTDENQSKQDFSNVISNLPAQSGIVKFAATSSE